MDNVRTLDDVILWGDLRNLVNSEDQQEKERGWKFLTNLLVFVRTHGKSSETWPEGTHWPKSYGRDDILNKDFFSITQDPALLIDGYMMDWTYNLEYCQWLFAKDAAWLKHIADAYVFGLFSDKFSKQTLTEHWTEAIEAINLIIQKEHDVTSQEPCAGILSIISLARGEEPAITDLNPVMLARFWLKDDNFLQEIASYIPQGEIFDLSLNTGDGSYDFTQEAVQDIFRSHAITLISPDTSHAAIHGITGHNDSC